jgi:hypothetical protein
MAPSAQLRLLQEDPPDQSDGLPQMNEDYDVKRLLD